MAEVGWLVFFGCEDGGPVAHGGGKPLLVKSWFVHAYTHVSLSAEKHVRRYGLGTSKFLLNISRGIFCCQSIWTPWLAEMQKGISYFLLKFFALKSFQIMPREGKVRIFFSENESSHLLLLEESSNALDHSEVFGLFVCFITSNSFSQDDSFRSNPSKPPESPLLLALSFFQSKFLPEIS